MFGARHRSRYSLYHPSERGKTSSTLIRSVVFLFVAYQLVTLLLLAAMRVDSGSMEPTLTAGDRILVSPIGYGARVPLSGWSTPTLREPQRGDLVVIASPLQRPTGFFIRMLDPVVRFFTANRVNLISIGSSDSNAPYLIRRIVALPGDTVELRGFAARITTASADHAASELVLSQTRYTPEIGGITNGSAGLSFADTEPLTLASGEYFVLGDNRPLALDSRHFGPVAREQVRYRVILRYWPIRRFGVPVD